MKESPLNFLSLIINNISNLFLTFSQDTLIIPLIILGYIWLDKKIFFNAICLILISIHFNSTLKCTFQVPLSPTLHKEGFAFPSGHMQSSVVLYGFLFTEIRSFLVKSIIIALLFGIGFSLVYFGFHNYFDILGAIFFGVLLIFSYKFLLKINNDKIIYPLILCFVSFLMLYIAFVYKIKENLWMSYYALIGVMLSEYYFKNKKTILDKKNKITATFFCFLMMLIIRKTLTFNDLPFFVTQTQWILIGFCIPFSLHFCNYICFKWIFTYKK